MLRFFICEEKGDFSDHHIRIRNYYNNQPINAVSAKYTLFSKNDIRLSFELFYRPY